MIFDLDIYNKKGFTLIELLAVIVILAVIALIAIPIFLRIINNAKKDTVLATARSIIKTSELYALTHEDFNAINVLDTKLEYKGTKPESGVVQIKEDGQSRIAIYLNGYCVIKEYTDMDVSFKDLSKDECMFSDVEISNTPSISFKDNINTETVEVGSTITINKENINVTNGTIDNIKITVLKGEEVLYEGNDSYSIPDSEVGTYTIKYQYIDENNQSNILTKTIEVIKYSYLMVPTTQSGDTQPFLSGTIKRNQIESINFATTNVVPEGMINSWDVSADQDGSVMAWYQDNDSDSLYEVTIGAEGGVVANPDSSYLFAYLSNITSLDVTNLNTFTVTTMKSMFVWATKLTRLDLSGFDTSKVTDMSGMFIGMSSLTSLDVSSFDTSLVTTMNSMFSNVSTLTSLDLSSFNTSNVTEMQSMFSYASSLISLDLSSFDTSNVTNMSQMFNMMSSLTSLDLSHFNTSKVTDMARMFQGMSKLTSLDLSNFDTSNVTDMDAMFYNVSSLTNIDLSNFDTSNVTDTDSMFSDMAALTVLDLSNFDTSNVTTMNYMFGYMTNLTELNLSSATFNKATAYDSMFKSSKSGVKIIAKDNTAASWLRSRLSNSSITGTVTVATTQ